MDGPACTVHEVTRLLLHLLFDNAGTRRWRGGGGVVVRCHAMQMICTYTGIQVGLRGKPVDGRTTERDVSTELKGLSLIISNVSNRFTSMHVRRHGGVVSLTGHLFDPP